jgi:glycosyltransferase involved in cell wall biosynthesis
VLFVGSFAKDLSDGRIGGQMIACYSLINSSLNDNINWVLLDTTAVLPIQHFFIRLLKAFKRILLFTYYLIFKKIHTVLIFSSSGLSLIEKGKMVLIASLFNKKVVFAPRSGLILNDLKTPLKRTFIKIVFKKSDFIVCQGKKWKKIFSSLSEDVDENKFKVIPNWVDPEIYKPLSQAPKTNPIRILYLGWVKKYKGIFDLLNSLAAIKTELKNTQIIIGGNGDDFEKSKNLIRELNLERHVILKGWVGFDEKIELLQNCHIFVLPSHFEGFPNALLEAMSSGLASIATDVGAISDVLVNEENGFLIQAKNINSLSRKLLALIENGTLRTKMANNARNTILESYTKNVAIQKFKNILLTSG